MRWQLDLSGIANGAEPTCLINGCSGCGGPIGPDMRDQGNRLPRSLIVKSRDGTARHSGQATDRCLHPG
eukprot:scaffold211702_cov27-Tisochrysis_lutea.AAC.5